MEERGGTRVGTEKMLLNRRVERNLVGNKGFKIMIEKVIIDQIPQKPSFAYGVSLMRMLVTEDSKPTRLSEQSIAALGHHLPNI
ncbi:pre-rRNA-processing protein IPI1 [Vigna unguiculata]|uniref:Pre-rRNA-processing protein IPI1 n=1 Tax=Vigna unguiculata TaxID=3917 RepID=A0A4D6LVB8_VIGUN|nr:pre-rRNA-processing protein IPI1 [Vigna unguiculata]